MAYKGKIYVAYDALNDQALYEELKKLKQSDGSSFNFYDGATYASELDITNDDQLKAKIQKNMDKADIVLVLLSKTLKSMRRFSKWQIEYAINSQKAIITMNNSLLRGIDYDITPTALKNHLSLIIPCKEEALELACMNWPKSAKAHYENGDKLPVRYEREVYEQLFNEEDTEE